MIRSLGYEDNLSLEEAKERYLEVSGEYERIRNSYSSGVGALRKRFGFMRKRDVNRLMDCFSVLLPLSAQGSVQEQYLKSEFRQDSVLRKSCDLNHELLIFLAGFRNTGVKRLEGTLDY